VPVVRKAEIKSLEMGASDPPGAGGSTASASPSPAPATTSNAATREVSYAKEKPVDKPAENKAGSTGQPGKDC
jgi:hypothetical protein